MATPIDARITFYDQIKEAIEKNHKWFMENLKSEFLDVIEGYYNMLQFEIWWLENPNLHSLSERRRGWKNDSDLHKQGGEDCREAVYQERWLSS